MPQKLREVMTPGPVTLSKTATLKQAAEAMRDQAIGDILIVDGERICGILTDRDIAVRAVAEGRDPQKTRVGDVATTDMSLLGPDDKVEDAVKVMRERAVRRVPIVEGSIPIGIVSIGDLAVETDPESALADISAAAPNE